MKKILTAAASLAALGVAAPAFAANPQTIVINGTNPPQCNVSATQTTVTLPTNSISDANGFVNPSLASAVATELNGAGVVAWCTGTHNAVVLSRTALTTGAGAVTTNGFAEGAIYDIQVDIAGAVRGDAWPVLEDTTDGAGNGPGIGAGSGTYVGPFGPSGSGSAATFAAVASANPSAVTNGTAGGEGATGAFSTTGNRLVAGSYTGTVTLTLTPGV